MESRHPIHPALLRDVIQLAHLDCATLDLDRLQRDLSKILLYMERIRHAKSDTFPSSATTSPREACPTREDDPLPGLARDAALGNAPDRQDPGWFRVPRVVPGPGKAPDTPTGTEAT